MPTSSTSKRRTLLYPYATDTKQTLQSQTYSDQMSNNDFTFVDIPTSSPLDSTQHYIYPINDPLPNNNTPDPRDFLAHAGIITEPDPVPVDEDSVFNIISPIFRTNHTYVQLVVDLSPFVHYQNLVAEPLYEHQLLPQQDLINHSYNDIILTSSLIEDSEGIVSYHVNTTIPTTISAPTTIFTPSNTPTTNPSRSQNLPPPIAPQSQANHITQQQAILSAPFHTHISFNTSSVCFTPGFTRQPQLYPIFLTKSKQNHTVFTNNRFISQYRNLYRDIIIPQYQHRRNDPLTLTDKVLLSEQTIAATIPIFSLDTHLYANAPTNSSNFPGNSVKLQSTTTHQKHNNTTNNIFTVPLPHRLGVASYYSASNNGLMGQIGLNNPFLHHTITNSTKTPTTLLSTSLAVLQDLLLASSYYDYQISQFVLSLRADILFHKNNNFVFEPLPPDLSSLNWGRDIFTFRNKNGHIVTAEHHHTDAISSNDSTLFVQQNLHNPAPVSTHVPGKPFTDAPDISPTPTPPFKMHPTIRPPTLKRITILGVHGWKLMIGFLADFSGKPISQQLCEQAMLGVKETILNQVIIDAIKVHDKHYRIHTIFPNENGPISLPMNNNTPKQIPTPSEPRQQSLTDTIKVIIPSLRNILYYLGIEINLIPLFSYGSIQQRLAEYIGSLTGPNSSKLQVLQQSDIIYMVGHSQGSVIASGIIKHMIEKNLLNPYTKHCIMVMTIAGVLHGPFTDLPSDMLPATRELFKLASFESAVQKQTSNNVRYLKEHNVSTCHFAAWGDAVVPLHSALHLLPMNISQQEQLNLPQHSVSTQLSDPSILENGSPTDSIGAISADNSTNTIYKTAQLHKKNKTPIFSSSFRAIVVEKPKKFVNTTSASINSSQINPSVVPNQPQEQADNTKSQDSPQPHISLQNDPNPSQPDDITSVKPHSIFIHNQNHQALSIIKSNPFMIIAFIALSAINTTSRFYLPNIPFYHFHDYKVQNYTQYRGINIFYHYLTHFKHIYDYKRLLSTYLISAQQVLVNISVAARANLFGSTGHHSDVKESQDVFKFGGEFLFHVYSQYQFKLYHKQYNEVQHLLSNNLSPTGGVGNVNIVQNQDDSLKSHLKKALNNDKTDNFRQNHYFIDILYDGLMDEIITIPYIPSTVVKHINASVKGAVPPLPISAHQKSKQHSDKQYVVSNESPTSLSKPPDPALSSGRAATARTIQKQLIAMTTGTATGSDPAPLSTTVGNIAQTPTFPITTNSANNALPTAHLSQSTSQLTSSSMSPPQEPILSQMSQLEQLDLEELIMKLYDVLVLATRSTFNNAIIDNTVNDILYYITHTHVFPTLSTLCYQHYNVKQNQSHTNHIDNQVTLLLNNLSHTHTSYNQLVLSQVMNQSATTITSKDAQKNQNNSSLSNLFNHIIPYTTMNLPTISHQDIAIQSPQTVGVTIISFVTLFQMYLVFYRLYVNSIFSHVCPRPKDNTEFNERHYAVLNNNNKTQLPSTSQCIPNSTSISHDQLPDTHPGAHLISQSTLSPQTPTSHPTSQFSPHTPPIPHYNHNFDLYHFHGEISTINTPLHNLPSSQTPITIPINLTLMANTKSSRHSTSFVPNKSLLFNTHFSLISYLSTSLQFTIISPYIKREYALLSSLLHTDISPQLGLLRQKRYENNPQRELFPSVTWYSLTLSSYPDIARNVNKVISMLQHILLTHLSNAMTISSARSVASFTDVSAVPNILSWLEMSHEVTQSILKQAYVIYITSSIAQYYNISPIITDILLSCSQTEINSPHSKNRDKSTRNLQSAPISSQEPTELLNKPLAPLLLNFFSKRIQQLQYLQQQCDNFSTHLLIPFLSSPPVPLPNHPASNLPVPPPTAPPTAISPPLLQVQSNRRYGNLISSLLLQYQYCWTLISRIVVLTPNYLQFLLQHVDSYLSSTLQHITNISLATNAKSNEPGGNTIQATNLSINAQNNALLLQTLAKTYAHPVSAYEKQVSSLIGLLNISLDHVDNYISSNNHDPTANDTSESNQLEPLFNPKYNTHPYNTVKKMNENDQNNNEQRAEVSLTGHSSPNTKRFQSPLISFVTSLTVDNIPHPPHLSQPPNILATVSLRSPSLTTITHSNKAFQKNATSPRIPPAEKPGTTTLKSFHRNAQRLVHYMYHLMLHAITILNTTEQQLLPMLAIDKIMYKMWKDICLEDLDGVNINLSSKSTKTGQHESNDNKHLNGKDDDELLSKPLEEALPTSARERMKYFRKMIPQIVDDVAHYYAQMNAFNETNNQQLIDFLFPKSSSDKSGSLTDHHLPFAPLDILDALNHPFYPHLFQKYSEEYIAKYQHNVGSKMKKINGKHNFDLFFRYINNDEDFDTNCDEKGLYNEDGTLNTENADHSSLINHVMSSISSFATQVVRSSKGIWESLWTSNENKTDEHKIHGNKDVAPKDDLTNLSIQNDPSKYQQSQSRLIGSQVNPTQTRGNSNKYYNRITSQYPANL